MPLVFCSFTLTLLASFRIGWALPPLPSFFQILLEFLEISLQGPKVLTFCLCWSRDQYPLPLPVMLEALLPAFYYLSFVLFIWFWMLFLCLFSYGSGHLLWLKEKKALGTEDFDLRPINTVIFVQEWKYRPSVRLHRGRIRIRLKKKCGFMTEGYLGLTINCLYNLVYNSEQHVWASHREEWKGLVIEYGKC